MYVLLLVIMLGSKYLLHTKKSISNTVRFFMQPMGALVRLHGCTGWSGFLLVYVAQFSFNMTVYYY